MPGNETILSVVESVKKEMEGRREEAERLRGEVARLRREGEEEKGWMQEKVVRVEEQVEVI